MKADFFQRVGDGFTTRSFLMIQTFLKINQVVLIFICTFAPTNYTYDDIYWRTNFDRCGILVDGNGALLSEFGSKRLGNLTLNGVFFAIGAAVCQSVGLVIGK